jgi:hypothetical protein
VSPWPCSAQIARLCWPTGTDQMLVVSVGSRTSPKANQELAPEDMNIIYNASSIHPALMFAALNEQDMLCRVFGNCLHGPPRPRGRRPERRHGPRRPEAIQLPALHRRTDSRMVRR